MKSLRIERAIKRMIMEKPLCGLKVIESALQYPGPYCGMLLTQLGAEVTKLETPGSGDPARSFPGFFDSINCNKKSIALNLKTDEGKQVFYDLIKSYDVFMEGFRPGVVDRLGISYEVLSKLNPGLIYCSITGYGQNGPYHKLPGHDLNYQAVSGMLHCCFKDQHGRFILPGIAIGDVTSGMFSALSIVSALNHRNKTGAGRYIDVSMTEGLISVLSTHLGILFQTGSTDRIRDAGYDIFKAADNKHIALGIAHEDWFWEKLCSAMELHSLRGLNALQRRQKRRELIEQLQEAFLKKNQKEWLELLSAADVPVSAVNNLNEAVSDPQLTARQIFQETTSLSGKALKCTNFPAHFSLEMRSTIQKPPPELGEHTEIVLRERGYTLQAIEKLKQNKII
ncbi:MAG: CoA transferase [Desulfobacteraceae bacterium]|nr:MAG: CoA transferase [Desulfobacteraceae bacterium]